MRRKWRTVRRARPFRSRRPVLLSEAASPVEGWTLSVKTADPAVCTIVGATMDGTDASVLFDEGAQLTEVTTGTDNIGAISDVTLSLTQPREFRSRRHTAQPAPTFARRNGSTGGYVLRVHASSFRWP